MKGELDGNGNCSQVQGPPNKLGEPDILRPSSLVSLLSICLEPH